MASIMNSSINMSMFIIKPNISKPHYQQKNLTAIVCASKPARRKRNPSRESRTPETNSSKPRSLQLEEMPNYSKNSSNYKEPEFDSKRRMEDVDVNGAHID
ncbi:hypothetical protein O6P43_029211 [Quillaja saponaria]|uniref:Uncharacterized protein n=1 Tax=Quillaja saponaria TaxID=32244 RepID=A0AAD7PB57_QUISA|nr:hypothetical protein O6P43_029211 [Quillaja saponaria]